jgi:nucleotide-binding universal stress UspA family protein
MTHRVLVPVDFSDASAAAARYAIAMGRAGGLGVELSTACLLPPYVAPSMALALAKGSAPITAEELARRHATESMKRFLEELGPRPDVSIETTIEVGEAADVIQRKMESCDAVVMGTHGRTGIDRLFLGSVAAKAIRSASVPVYTVRADARAEFPPKLIVAGVDFSPCSRAALDRAIDLGRRYGSKVEVFHAIPSPPALRGLDVMVAVAGTGRLEAYDAMAIRMARDEVRSFLSTAPDDPGPCVTVEIADPASSLLSFAERHQADLVVVGTHGRTGLLRFVVGSVAEQVIRRARVPVLTVHGPS